jgi:hypothetical protein
VCGVNCKAGETGVGRGLGITGADQEHSAIWLAQLHAAPYWEGVPCGCTVDPWLCL